MVVAKCVRFMTQEDSVTAGYANRLFLIAYKRIAVTAGKAQGRSHFSHRIGQVKKRKR